MKGANNRVLVLQNDGSSVQWNTLKPLLQMMQRYFDRAETLTIYCPLKKANYGIIYMLLWPWFCQNTSEVIYIDVHMYQKTQGWLSLRSDFGGRWLFSFIYAFFFSRIFPEIFNHFSGHSACLDSLRFISKVTHANACFLFLGTRTSEPRDEYIQKTSLTVFTFVSGWWEEHLGTSPSTRKMQKQLALGRKE